MTKHSYDKEFKEQAVQYYLDNKDHMTMNEISKNLGIGASTFTVWSSRCQESKTKESRGNVSGSTHRPKKRFCVASARQKICQNMITCRIPHICGQRKII